MTFASAIEHAPSRAISAADYLETAIVIDGSRDPVAQPLRRTHSRGGSFDSAVTPEQARIAREAYRISANVPVTPAAQLRDCFAYALAKAKREPLLFKGRDFLETDWFCSVNPLLAAIVHREAT